MSSSLPVSSSPPVDKLRDHEVDEHWYQIYTNVVDIAELKETVLRERYVRLKSLFAAVREKRDNYGKWYDNPWQELVDLALNGMQKISHLVKKPC
jgi:hypothetical protein